jgi:hypothetical protein
MISLIFLLLGLGFLTYVYFFREAFLAELAISFLPYFVVGLGILAVVVLIVLICKIRGKGRKAQ